jgi:hypothetical protein
MAQLVLPIFPEGSTQITPSLVIEKSKKTIWYFHGCIPIFSHPEDDLASFRMFTSQLIVNGNCKQVDIIKAFAVPAISVKRAVKLYREEGIHGFFKNRPLTRTPRVLTPEILESAQDLLNNGLNRSEVAEELTIKVDTLRKAINDGRLNEKEEKEKKTKVNGA